MPEFSRLRRRGELPGAKEHNSDGNFRLVHKGESGRLRIPSGVESNSRIAAGHAGPVYRIMHVENPDVILIGSGIMSSHLGALLKCLDPRLSLQVYELTEGLAQDSSDGWNNAGTGHAGLCELSYTPDRAADGTVDVSQAIRIFGQFEL